MIQKVEAGKNVDVAEIPPYPKNTSAQNSLVKNLSTSGDLIEFLPISKDSNKLNLSESNSKINTYRESKTSEENSVKTFISHDMIKMNVGSSEEVIIKNNLEKKAELVLQKRRKLYWQNASAAKDAGDFHSVNEALALVKLFDEALGILIFIN